MRIVLSLAIVLTLTACGGGGESNASVQDTLTKRERDSIIGASALPGARTVRGALRVADSAAARSRRIDSIAGTVN